MIVDYSELNERQKEQAACMFIRWVGESPDDYTYEVTLDGSLLSRKKKGVDRFTERDEAPLVKPSGPCVTETDANGVIWKL